MAGEPPGVYRKMVQGKYKVICTGKAAPGRDREDVKRKLARLLEMDAARVERLLAGKPVLIRKNIDAGSAERWKTAFEGAGASAETDSSAGGSAPALARKPKLVSPEISHGAVAFAPKRCPKITGFEGGINLNRGDAGEIFFDHIRLLAAYSVSVEGEMKHRLLIFLKDQRRPFVIESTGIRYRDFPDVRSSSVLASLRNLLVYILNHNPDVAVDESTYAFLEGGRPHSAGSDETALATALGKLLLHGEHGEGTAGTAPAAPASATTDTVFRPVFQEVSPSQESRISRKVLVGILAAVGMLVLLGALAAFLVPAYFASQEVESADTLARSELANACTMAMKYTIQHPEVLMTDESLAALGYAVPESIELTVVDGRWDSLSMRARHRNGSRLYAADKYCYVTEVSGQ
jgi:hypothetical protein